MNHTIGCTRMLITVLTFVLVAVVLADEIHDVAQQGDIDRVKELIEENPELVNAPDDASQTPLHLAIAGGQTEIAEFLITKGADVNASNVVNQSIMLYAAYFGNAEIAEMLIAQGAQLNDQDAFGRAPLHYAARQHNFEATALLIENRAEIDIKDNIGETPLHFAIIEKNSEAIELLFLRKPQIKPSIDAPSTDGFTPLKRALEQRDFELADRLISELGAEVDFEKTAVVSFGRSILVPR